MLVINLGLGSRLFSQLKQQMFPKRNNTTAADHDDYKISYPAATLVVLSALFCAWQYRNVSIVVVVAYLSSCHQTLSDANCWVIRSLFFAMNTSGLEEFSPA